MLELWLGLQPGDSRLERSVRVAGRRNALADQMQTSTSPARPRPLGGLPTAAQGCDPVRHTALA